jgi:phenylalanyl-tRNA synthetase alpha chain
MSAVSAPDHADQPVDLEALATDATAKIAAASDLAALDEIEASLSGPLTAFRAGIATLPGPERPVAGERLRTARAVIDEAIGARRETLAASARAAALESERLDLTERAPAVLPGHAHLVTQVRAELEDIFLGMGYEIAEGREIETDWYNFTALNLPPYHPARSSQDSFYLQVASSERYLLRTQTSPVQIHLLERGELPIYAVAPGRVYRRDTPDARHLPEFHQIEGLVVDRDVSFADLVGTIDTFVKAIFGGSVTARLRPAYFPFTEPSAEFEVSCAICGGEGCPTCGQIGWIELGGCGMVHPAVFEATGIDPEIWTGFAFGFGIDRLAFMRHRFEDLRSLIENDVRFLRQF